MEAGEIFKNNEIVFFRAKGKPQHKDYDGKECRIVGTLKQYPVEGNQKVMLGYAVKFVDDGREFICYPSYLERSTPSRGDMDRLLTWEYVFETIGWKPRDRA